MGYRRYQLKAIAAFSASDMVSIADIWVDKCDSKRNREVSYPDEKAHSQACTCQSQHSEQVHALLRGCYFLRNGASHATFFVPNLRHMQSLGLRIWMERWTALELSAGAEMVGILMAFVVAESEVPWKVSVLWADENLVILPNRLLHRKISFEEAKDGETPTPRCLKWARKQWGVTEP